MPRPDLPSFNAADPQDVAAGARMEELRQRLERNDLVVALKIAEVRRVLFRILDQSGVFSDVYIPDPMELACRTGRQSVGRYLWGAIDDVDENAVMQLRAEARTKMRQLLVEADSMRTPTHEHE